VEAQLAKERQAQSKLQSEVAHYKVVLADTVSSVTRVTNHHIVETFSQSFSLQLESLYAQIFSFPWVDDGCLFSI